MNFGCVWRIIEKYAAALCGLFFCFYINYIFLLPEREQRVRRSPYALNPEYDEEREMQCTLRSWNRDEGGGGGGGGSLFPSGGTGGTSSRPSSQQPSPVGSEVGSPAGGGGRNNNEITASGVASAWLAQQEQNEQGDKGEGLESRDSSSNTLQKLLRQTADNEAHVPEILFKAVHSNAGTISRHSSMLSSSRTFSHIRNHSGPGSRATTPMTSRGRLPSPLIGRPPVSTIDKKNLVAADAGGGGGGDGTGSGSVGRSASTRRSRSAGRSRSRARRRGSSALAVAAVFDSQGLNDSGGEPYSNIMTAGGDSPYNSDGEGYSPNVAALPAYRIPTSDIIVVDVATERDNALDGSAAVGSIINRIYITTVSHGYFEVTFDSSNSHSVMAAFLRAALPPERVHRKVSPDDSPDNAANQTIFSTASCCADATVRQSFDMENFTAKELNETVKREGILDKLKRRITHIAGQCGDCEYASVQC